MKRRTKAFTLIELIIAIAILGIVLAIMAPSIIKVAYNVDKKKKENDVYILECALMSSIDKCKSVYIVSPSKLITYPLYSIQQEENIKADSFVVSDFDKFFEFVFSSWHVNMDYESFSKSYQPATTLYFGKGISSLTFENDEIRLIFSLEIFDNGGKNDSAHITMCTVKYLDDDSEYTFCI